MGDGAIDDQFVGHLNLAASFLDRFLFGISFQETLYEPGVTINGAEPLQTSRNGGTAFGDPRVSGMLRLFGHSDYSPISMHIGADVWIPRVGDANQRPRRRCERARHAASWFWRAVSPARFVGPSTSATTGATTRSSRSCPPPSRTSSATKCAPESSSATRRRATASTSVLKSGSPRTRSTTSSSTRSTPASRSWRARTTSSPTCSELVPQSAARLNRTSARPSIALLFRFAYAPLRKQPAPRVVIVDTDKDGIPDTEDACPGTPGVRTIDPKTNGCPPPPPDRDHDGVLDPDDLCPDEPVGDHPDPKRPGCPAKDSDGDGVYDYEDACPDTPAGAHPDPAKKGCPAIDSDGDGVYDYEDKCPQVPAGAHPETRPTSSAARSRTATTTRCRMTSTRARTSRVRPSPDPKKNGCPGLVEVKNGVIVIFQPVFFATNKDTILKKSFPVLNAVADALKAEPEIKKIMIEGHTDNKGKASRNMELSDRRARSVLHVHGQARHRLRAPRRPGLRRLEAGGRQQDVEGPRRQPPRRVPHRRPAADERRSPD